MAQNQPGIGGELSPLAPMGITYLLKTMLMIHSLPMMVERHGTKELMQL